MKRLINLCCPVATALWGILGAVQTSASTLVTWGSGQNTPLDLGSVTAVSSAADHTLALLPAGSVVSWGYNFDRQTEVPPGLSGVLSVAAGDFFSLALKADGTVAAWGDNQFGQCNVPPNLSGVLEISAGRAHCLARRIDGSIVAWGNNAYGQCDVPAGVNNSSAVLARWNYSMALKADGTVAVWGDNGAGQANAPEGLGGVTAIAGNMDYCMALRSDGTVVGWGRYPSPPFPLNGVLAIAAGEDHCLALLSGGTVFAWGGDASGQSSVPSGLSDVSSIAAAWNYSLAITGSRGSPQFSLQNPARNGETFTVSVASDPGVSYTLQYKDALNDSGWTDLTPLQGTGGTLTLTDSLAKGAQRFYRVVAR